MSGAAQSIARGTAGQQKRWPVPLTLFPPAAIIALGLSFGLLPLFRGRLFLFNDNGNEYLHTESWELRRFERVTQGLTSILGEHQEQATKFSGFLDFLGAKYVTGPSNFPFAGWKSVDEAAGMAAWRIPGFRGAEYLVGNVEQEPRIATESIVPEIGLGWECWSARENR